MSASNSWGKESSPPAKEEPEPDDMENAVKGEEIEYELGLELELELALELELELEFELELA